MAEMSPVELLQAAAAKVLADGVPDGAVELLADWLEGAALEAQEIGADFRAERFAKALLGLRDA